jgi:hypothetical protein
MVARLLGTDRRKSPRVAAPGVFKAFRSSTRSGRSPTWRRLWSQYSDEAAAGFAPRFRLGAELISKTVFGRADRHGQLLAFF